MNDNYPPGFENDPSAPYNQEPDEAEEVGYVERPTQQARVLKILEDAKGDWIDGMSFLHLNPPITQYHARIWGLQQKGYQIEGRFVQGKNWKEYRLF